MPNIRNPNVFEKILLVIGILIVIVGYGLVHKLAMAQGILTWDLVNAAFLWLIIIALVILVAVNENIKEELREIILIQLDEIRLLRKDFQNKKR
ncbi:hypothetical protein GF351_02450 [Candidatus Woesearchaeota archaeon]|nr:hypothetical protein [Candidatus Woesearchaeota archaeon]